MAEPINITPEDLQEFSPGISTVKAERLIKSAIALAKYYAPCLDDPDLKQETSDAIEAVIFGALQRWADSGSGALSAKQQQAGPFGQTLSYDTRSPQRSGFYSHEIEQLQRICKSVSSGKRPKQQGMMFLTAPERKTCPVSGCTYLLGSASSPCTSCGETINPDYRW